MSGFFRQREDFCGDGFPAVFTGNADAAGVAEVGAVRGVAGEGEDGVGDAGRIRVAREHSWESVAAKILALAEET